MRLTRTAIQPLAEQANAQAGGCISIGVIIEVVRVIAVRTISGRIFRRNPKGHTTSIKCVIYCAGWASRRIKIVLFKIAVLHQVSGRIAQLRIRPHGHKKKNACHDANEY